MKKAVCPLIFISVVLAILLLKSFVFADTKAEKNFDSVFKITKSEMNFSESTNCKYITCMGEIQNLSDKIWEDLVIEVKYFDSNGLLIDTETERLYAHVLQANGKIAFRVRAKADRSAPEYSDHSARITWAEKRDSYLPQKKPKKQASLFIEILISWTPMIILIGVWIVFMYWHFSNKKSPQSQSLEVLKTQIGLFEKQNQLFERLVKAIEKPKVE